MDANVVTTGGNTSTGPVIALTKGKTGIYASFNGGTPKLFNVEGQLNEQALIARLMSTAKRTVKVRALIIGTRNDGSPGWNEIDAETMAGILPSNISVIYLSEAEALHRSFAEDGQKCAYLIFATTKPGDEIHGSVRWWVQDGKTVQRADVHYLGQDHGQIFTMAGGSFMANPAMVAGLVEELLAQHPDVTHAYVWSQDGMADLPGYVTAGQFWRTLRMPQTFTDNGGIVGLQPTATDVLELASAHELYGDSDKKTSDA